MKKTPPKKARPKQQELNTLFDELKSEYLETFSEKISQIESAWQAYNRKQLESEFHKIKGTGSTYGVTEATVVAEVMEELCHEGSKQLGLCVFFSLELFKQIQLSYQSKNPIDLTKDKRFKFLKARQDELESA